MIKVRPAPGLRGEFARWAVAQDPPLNTCSHAEFGVPDDVYVHMPEELLIGSHVNGHPYRSPLVEEQQTAASQEIEGTPGEPLPEVPAEAYGPDAVPLDPPEAWVEPKAQVEPLAFDEPAQGEPVAFGCDLCPRDFTTERGRDTHRRQVHPGGGN
ncbi:hypothetical protein SUDANB1_05666 [Streptomyces sp. enrichment culture]|uniref:hypothetical protein n=1 Tax=Streptomyces sp. enrichment culture TaxID=1795815 RepID=UPI003F570BDE